MGGGATRYHGRVPLLLAGIDEAGYGPTLGPLCVGLSVFRIRDWNPGDPAPDLWRLLKSGICRKPGDARRRIPVADSKRLKLANDVKTRHPLVHLERGVLAFLRSLDAAPATDAEFFSGLGADLGEHPWYRVDPTPLPIALTPGEIAIAGGRIAAALERAGIELVDLRCAVVCESAVNQAIQRTGSKAEATAAAVGEHLRRVVAHWKAAAVPEAVAVGGGPDTPPECAASESPPALRIVCDQLGGRTQYQGILTRELPGAEVVPLTETGERSRYSIAPEAVVQFMPEAEASHLPVALASMVAKLVRELCMARFNRYWCARCPGLKPTAGYAQDARRWLDDMHEVLSPEERAAMVRIA